MTESQKDIQGDPVTHNLNILLDSKIEETPRLEAAVILASDLNEAGRNALFNSLEYLTGREWFIWQIVKIISDIDDPRVLDALIRYTEYPSCRVQSTALCGLAKSGHTGAYTLIENFINDSRENNEGNRARIIGIEAAGVLASRRMFPLLKLTLEKHPKLGERIAKSMQEMIRKHPDLTEEVVTSLSEYLAINLTCMACLELLEEVATTSAHNVLDKWQIEAKQFLVEKFSSDDEENHIEAMYFIYNFQEHMSEVVTADPLVREYGIPILIRLLRKYLEANQSGEELPGVSLWVIGDSRVTDELIEMVECGPTPYTRFYVFYALGFLGDSRVVPLLLSQLTHHEEQQREYAFRGLIHFVSRDHDDEERKAALQAIDKTLTDTSKIDDKTRVCDFAARLRGYLS